ncbi:MAG TPA: hypothetical protein VFT22_21955, partial [Kofleriaceae bacterium]|nr:hypothetical protein [Kofleriaceae bacterium]
VLRPACPATAYWDGATCRPRGDGAARVAAARQALAQLDVDVARQALAAADRGGPLDHDANVTLWEQRGIAAAYLDDERGASAAFDMLLALDPGHFLSYTLSPKATFVFEKARNDARTRGVPALDVHWPHGQRVGDPLPLDLEVVADPKRFLRRATVFVRARGEAGWRATDVALAGGADARPDRQANEPAGPRAERRIVLPAIEANRPVSLELYLRAYDDRGNEVLTWADPARPREIPLRYDPPIPWYRRGWFYAAVGSVVAATVGVTVYELTIAPPDKVPGTVSVR